jgi:hypothetical protein
MAQIQEGHLAALQSRYERCLEDLRNGVALGTIDMYRILQRELVYALLHERKLSWCSECTKLMPCEEASFVLTEGNEKDISVPWMSRRERHGVKRFCYLLRVCDTCFCTLTARSQNVKSEVVLQEPRESFFAYPAELRHDGLYFMQKDGVWQPIPADASRVIRGREQTMEKLAKALGLPTQ